MGSRKRRHDAEAVASPDRSTTPAGPGPEVLRRGLLALVTALLVARPMILGEDPGLLSPLSDPGGLVITMLWFLAAVIWAVWRAWSGHTTWYGGLVEAGLLGVVLFMAFSTTGAARYKHPAWLISWEWLALLVALFLVRQLAVSAGDQQGLLAALLATAVALSVYGIYQHQVELPQTRALYPRPDPDQVNRPRPEHAALVAGPAPHLAFPAGLPWAALSMSSQIPLQPLQADMARQGLFLDADDPRIEALYERIEADNIYSRFFHPNSFAGYLVLLLPAMLGCIAASRMGRQLDWQVLLIAAGALAMIVALWLTHSRGAILALLVTGAAGAGGLAWRLRRGPRALAAGGLALGLVIAAALLLSGAGDALFGKEQGTARARLDYWSATWKMIAAHPWLGVGPGNFGRHYPRFMSPSAHENISDPHNFALEIWAAAGVFALACLLLAFAAFFRPLLAVALRPPAVKKAPARDNEPPEVGNGERVNWEFYLGGMIGLLISFLVRAPGKTPDEILLEGVAAGGLSIVWFGTFALLEGVRWTGPGRALVLAGGVAALLLNLCVSGGISFPSMALPMWVVVGLALNALPLRPSRGAGKSWLALVVPVPLLAAICLLYFAQVFASVTHSASLTRTALDRARRLWDAPGQADDNLVQQPDLFIVRRVLPPLQKAAESDRRDARTHLHLSHWYGEVWKYHPRQGVLSESAINHAGLVHGGLRPQKSASAIDPEGREGYLAEYRLRLLFAQWVQSDQTKQKEQYRLAARAMREVVVRHPTEARLRYQLAEVLFKSGNAAEGEKEARETLKREEQATRQSRKLTDQQREQIQKWLKSPPS